VANTLAYCVRATLTAVKSFIVQSPGVYSAKLFNAITMPLFSKLVRL